MNSAGILYMYTILFCVYSSLILIYVFRLFFFFFKTREDKFISNHLLNIYYMSETGNVDVYKPEKKNL